MRAGIVKLAILAVLVAVSIPIKAKAQALPELPQTTVAQLRLLNTQGEEIALNSQGCRFGDLASTILTFEGLYRTLQEWNSWTGGDDYIVQRAYVMERTQLPDWLAEYSGEVLFWEIEYFGTSIEMLTDNAGNVLTDTNNHLAMNLKIKDIAYYTAGKFMQANNYSVANIPIPQGNIENSIASMKKPYITGKELHFYIYINGVEHQILLNDFTQCIIGCGSTSSQWGRWVFLPCFAKLSTASNADNIIFYDETTHQALSTVANPSGFSVNDRGNTVFKLYSFKMPVDVMPAETYAGDSELKYFIPATYRRWSGITPSIYATWNDGQPTVNGFGFNGSLDPLLYNTAIQAYYLNVGNGQEVQGLTNKVPLNSTISADSAQDIVDAIAQIQPQTDPQTGIEIIEIPQNFPLPESVPLEQEDPYPNTPVYPDFEDFPESDPATVPDQDPNVNPSTEATEETLPDSAEQIPVQENLSIVTGLQNRFPFSIPWDIYNALSHLSAQREIPHWEWTMQVNIPFTETVFEYTFVLDLGFMASTAQLFRMLFLLAFILGLAVFSYNKFFGGGA